VPRTGHAWQEQLALVSPDFQREKCLKLRQNVRQLLSF
jgi:hypothetical protein